MCEKIKSIVTRHKWFLSVVAVVLVVCFLLLLFKKGSYVDEIFTFAFANSTVGAFIEPSFDSYFKNFYAIFNKWIDGDVFFRWLVGDGNRFQYATMYENLAKDVHPPLYYLLLHTFCSVFSNGEFSYFPGLLLNGIIYILTMFIWYRLSIFLLKDKQKAALIVLILALMPITIDMLFFIRMYLLLMAAVSGLFLAVLPLCEGEAFSIKRKIGVFVAASISFSTHFYGLLYAFFLSVGIGIFFLCRRQYRVLFQLAVIMIAAFLAALIIFPPYLNVLFFSQRGNDILSSFSLIYLGPKWLDYYVENILGSMIGILNGRYNFFAWPILIVFLLLWGYMYHSKGGKLSISMKLLFWTAGLSSVFIICTTPNIGRFNGRYYAVSIVLFALGFLSYVGFWAGENLRRQKAVVIVLLCLSVGCIGRAFYSPYLFSDAQAKEMGEILHNRRALFIVDYDVGLYACAPVFKEARAIYLSSSSSFYDARVGHDTLDVNERELENDVSSGPRPSQLIPFLESDELSAGDLVFHYVGKYAPAPIYKFNKLYGLKWIGFYRIERQAFDVYEKDI